jgi:hypothetical protein
LKRYKAYGVNYKAFAAAHQYIEKVIFSGDMSSEGGSQLNMFSKKVEKNKRLHYNYLYEKKRKPLRGSAQSVSSRYDESEKVCAWTELQNRRRGLPKARRSARSR